MSFNSTVRDAHDACRNVSVRTDTLSHVDTTPLTERKHRCVSAQVRGFEKSTAYLKAVTTSCPNTPTHLTHSCTQVERTGIEEESVEIE